MAPLQKSTAPQPDPLLIQHFIHPHPLSKLFMAFEFNCDGCNMRGHGVRFRCAACDFDLHEQCAASPHHLSSHIHPHHQLALVNRPGKSQYFCDVCKDFTDGLSYTCQPCGFDVHIHCAQIPVATESPKSTMDQGWQQATTPFGGYYEVNNSKPVMINHQQYQQQQQQQQQQYGIPTAAYGGYNGMNNNNNQAVMINHHQHHQQQGVPMTAFVGYQNQPVMMMNQQQYQQQPQQVKSNNYSKMGKFAANVLTTSLIGVPLFNSKN